MTQSCHIKVHLASFILPSDLHLFGWKCYGLQRFRPIAVKGVDPTFDSSPVKSLRQNRS